MIELRYIIKPVKLIKVDSETGNETWEKGKVLQYRQDRPITGAGMFIWTEWADVPTVEEPE